MKDDMYAYSSPEIIAMFGERFKHHRQLLGMTQRDVADKAGLSVMTVHKFESGASRDVSLTTIIRLWRVIGQLDNVNELLPEVPESPYLGTARDYTIKRVRK